MKKILILLVCILFSHFMNAQQIYFNSGKNFTQYNYKTTPGQSQPNLKNDFGNYYEIGYEHDLNKSLIYMGGLTLNQFNTIGGDQLNYYSWETNYIGLQNVIGYSFYNKNAFKALVTSGVGVSTLFSGTQQINNSFYDLKDQDNFNGIFVQPSLGLELRYNLQDMVEFSLKYNFSKAWNVSEVNEGEKLSFNNNQLAIGVHIPLKKPKSPLGDMQQDIEVLKKDQSKTATELEVVKSGVIKPVDPLAEAADKTFYLKDLINRGYVSAYFGVGKTVPTNVSSGGIDFVLTYLRSNPSSTVRIYGSADEAGATKYNNQLALARANSVKDILKAAGIQENRITVVSKGEDTSVDSKSVEAKRLVRRVIFQVN